jgi:subtilisin family serine protease
MRTRRLRRIAATLLVGVGATAAVVSPPAPAQAADGDGEVVVKVAAGTGCGLAALLARYPIETVSTVLASRHVYLVRWKEPSRWTDPEADALAKKLTHDGCVSYAERDRDVALTDQRYHAWPTGVSRPSTEAEWRSQPATWRLRLGKSGKLSRGAGTTVAVLDTGVDATHPAIARRVIPGWDYVDDDSDPSDEPGGAAGGHGTFVAGLVHLVAPASQIISMRVLDHTGTASGYLIAEAVHDAVLMGASIVNLSLGTVNKTESKVLSDVIKWARRQGTLTVAAAGNDGTEQPYWPAALPETVSVAALDATNSALAPYSNRGRWVDYATIGTDLISLMPGGGYDAWSGTSMASPVVAGQLALIEAADPSQDPRQVESELRETTTALWNATLRHGRTDILASLLRTLR